MLDPKWQDRAASADDVMQHIQSNQRVFIHGAAATPLPLLDAMVRRNNVENVRLYHLHTEGDCAFAQPEHQGRFRSVSLFTGGHLRKAVEEGRGDFIPVFLSDIPDLFREGTIPLDVAVVQLSLPDRHGMCSLGTSVDAARAAVDTAKVVLAEINEQMPSTRGNSSFPLQRVTAFFRSNRPLPQMELGAETEVEGLIGDHIAGLVENGSTLQMGIGGIPDAVLTRLHNKADLLVVPPADGDADTLQVSAKTGLGLDVLHRRLLALSTAGDAGEGAFSARARHVQALTLAAEQLAGARDELARERLELAAEALGQAHAALGEIGGKVGVDALLGHIFASFCIGK